MGRYLAAKPPPRDTQLRLSLLLLLQSLMRSMSVAQMGWVQLLWAMRTEPWRSRTQPSMVPMPELRMDCHLLHMDWRQQGVHSCSLQHKDWQLLRLLVQQTGWQLPRRTGPM